MLKLSTLYYNLFLIILKIKVLMFNLMHSIALLIVNLSKEKIFLFVFMDLLFLVLISNF